MPLYVNVNSTQRENPALKAGFSWPLNIYCLFNIAVLKTYKQINKNVERSLWIKYNLVKSNIKKRHLSIRLISCLNWFRNNYNTVIFCNDIHMFALERVFQVSSSGVLYISHNNQPHNENFWFSFLLFLILCQKDFLYAFSSDWWKVLMPRVNVGRI